MSFTSQDTFDVRLEWGRAALAALAGSRTYIIVDVLSFSTTVVTACERGGWVYPYPIPGKVAEVYASGHRAHMGAHREDAHSLSPRRMADSASANDRVVLVSPNGATLAFGAIGTANVLAGCLRNRTAVANRARRLGGPFAIIAAGERWPDDTLRPSFEDLVGAGAIAALLPGHPSNEARAAIAAFEACADDLPGALASCPSGRELVERGFGDDVDFAAQLDAATVAPQLIGEAFVQPIE